MAENDNNGPKSGPIQTERLHLEDRELMREWLKALRGATKDGIAAGKDATQRFSKRVLSRAEAKRKIHEAGRSIDDLLAMVERAPDNT